MVASHPTHHLTCVGSHAQADNTFPAANARAVARIFSSGLGPTDIAVQCLAGPPATVDALSAALDASANRRPRNHIFYFSGRTAARGIYLADGIFDARLLVDQLDRIGARSLLIIFDAAIGADPDQALAPSWARALVASRPAARFTAARATRIGAGAADAGLSRFTSAFLSALQTAPADIAFERTRFISDSSALRTTHDVLRERWGVTHQPIEIGNFGGIPLVRSQAKKPIGVARIVNVALGADASLAVAYTIEGRVHLPTTLHWTLETATGALLAEASINLLPETSPMTGRRRIRAPAKALRSLPDRAPVSRGQVALRWRVSLRDALDRDLDSTQHEFAFAPDASPRVAK